MAFGAAEDADIDQVVDRHLRFVTLAIGLQFTGAHGQVHLVLVVGGRRPHRGNGLVIEEGDGFEHVRDQILHLGRRRGAHSGYEAEGIGIRACGEAVLFQKAA